MWFFFSVRDMMRGDEVSEVVREFGGYEKMLMGMEGV